MEAQHDRPDHESEEVGPSGYKWPMALALLTVFTMVIWMIFTGKEDSM